MLGTVIFSNILTVLIVIAINSAFRGRWVVKDNFIYAVVIAGVVDVLLYLVFGPIGFLLDLLIWVVVVIVAWRLLEKRR